MDLKKLLIMMTYSLGTEDSIYSLYRIQIFMSMECPHKTWNPNILYVCVLSMILNPRKTL